MNPTRTQFAMVPLWVIEQVPDAIDLRIYTHLAGNYGDKDRYCFPKEETIAKDLGYGLRTVQRAIQRMRDAGAIRVVQTRKTDGNWGRNGYVLPLDDPQDQDMHPHGPPPQADVRDQRKEGVSAAQHRPPPQADHRPPPQAGREPYPLKQPDPSLKPSEEADASSPTVIAQAMIDREPTPGSNEDPPPLFEAEVQPPTSHARTRRGSTSRAQSKLDGPGKQPTGVSTTERAAALAERVALFDEWWDLYPRKVAKGDARRSWAKIVKTTDPRELINAVARYAASRRGEDPTFTAYPASWLRQERWLDEPTYARNGTGPGGDRAGGGQVRGGHQMYQQGQRDADEFLEACRTGAIFG